VIHMWRCRLARWKNERAQCLRSLTLCGTRSFTCEYYFWKLSSSSLLLLLLPSTSFSIFVYSSICIFISVCMCMCMYILYKIHICIYIRTLSNSRRVHCTLHSHTNSTHCFITRTLSLCLSFSLCTCNSFLLFWP